MEIRPGPPTVLVLDDGTELTLETTPVPTWETRGI